MKDYKKAATEILRLVGGEKNVSHLEHCSTRLRFTLADLSKADVDGLKKTEGVMTVISSGTQCQVVIGNDVIEVYDELMKLGKFSGGNAPAPVSGGKKDIGAVVLDMIVGIFQPLVPAIAGAGILKALLTICTTFGLLTAEDNVYKVIYYVADAALYYLPIMVAYTTATKLNCNKMVAVALAGAMIFPNTITLLATEGGATFFGLPLQNVSYTSQVFPAILSVAFMALVEKGVTKISPKPIRVFFVPMVCFMICFPVSLIVLGPIGYNIGALLTTVILALYNTLGWLAVALLAAFLPFMISTGMHKALVPYAVSSISDPGYEMLYMPASLAHNISESGACFAVAVRTKDSDLRSAAISGGISALFGITEPALYGVTLQNNRVLASVCGGGFAAGLFIGIMKVKAFVAMGPGLAGMAMFLDADNSMNLVWACIGFAIALVVSFILTLLLYKSNDVADAPDAPADTSSSSAAVAADTSPVVYSPMKGDVIALDKVQDEVFATGVLGDGVAVVPTVGELYAPADGVVDTIFDSKHAISMTTACGAELLMHIGMDTVKLGGKGYEPQVKNGESVRKGQLLMKFDIDAIRAAGYDLTTPVIVVNGDEFNICSRENGMVVPGAKIMELEAKA